ncbi:ABC transporter substrate-binding protein [Glutamicibacter sp. X7]
MARFKALSAVAVAAAAALALTSCGSGSSGPTATGGEVAGQITFLTNRTDLNQDGTWDKYIAEFQKKYPDASVDVEAITNYEDDVKTRMSTPNGYGDVLLIPNGVPQSQYADFFTPLGETSSFSNDYRFLNAKSVGGQQYGLALGGNANGVVYNKEVFKEAGITDLPKSEEEFLADLQLIKEKTDATPLYTNYKDGWPLGGQWTNIIGAVTANPEAQNEMAHNPAPWTEGTDIYALDSMLFDVVNKGFVEEDPLTTNWEQSKANLANGKIGTMVLGSWALGQLANAAEDAGADPKDIGFMTFPANVDGKQASTIVGDYYLGINKNSKNQSAARAWLDFLIQDSGFTEDEGMISAVKTDELPKNLSDLEENNVELLELSPAAEGEESLLSDLADKSQVDIWGNIYRQRLIDVARGQAAGDKDSVFAELNDSWGQAVSELANK